MRYIGHVINLAVQEALKTLKAEPVEETETYRMIYNSATLLIEFSKKDVISALWNYNVMYIFFEDSVPRELHLKNSVKHIKLSIGSQL